MKLRLKDDYLDTLREWRQDVENDIRRPCSWREIFRPDNTTTFADLEVGQAFVWVGGTDRHSRVKLSRSWCAHDSPVFGWIIGSEQPWRVIPGKIIDDEFVPDGEGE